MITRKARPSWLGDTDIGDHQVAGLKVPCIIRLKLFTLDNRPIVNQAGRLSERDRNKISQNIRLCLI
jgi:mRNA interferase MazF